VVQKKETDISSGAVRRQTPARSFSTIGPAYQPALLKSSIRISITNATSFV